METTLTEIKNNLRKIDWEINVDYLKDDTPLSEQGLDSLDMMDLLLCLEEGYAVKIPDTALPRLRTLNDFVAFINKKP